MRSLLSLNIIEKRGAYLIDPDGKSLGPGYLESAEQIKNNFDHYWRFYDGRSQSDNP